MLDAHAGEVVRVQPLGHGCPPGVERYLVALVGVAESRNAEVLALLGLAEHPAHGVHRRLLGAYLGEQRQHPLVHVGLYGVAGYVLLAGLKRDAGERQLALVVELIHHVAGEAVYLPDHDDVEQALLGVVHHAEELGAVVAAARERVVGIDARDLVAHVLAVARAGLHLVVYGRVALLVAREPRVDDCP
nr:hypothetical protein [Adlercreutzia equolifaciens]